MAIYYFDCQIISRGAGRSAVAAAAYRAGQKLTNRICIALKSAKNLTHLKYFDIIIIESDRWIQIIFMR